MSDETTGATGTQVDPGTQPPAGNGEAQAAEPVEQQAQPETISLEEAKKLRSESAALRRRLKEFEAEEQARKDADLSESERQTKRITELEAELASNRQSLVRERTVAAAARLGFTDPDDAVAIISRTDPEALAADGDGKAMDAALAALAKAKPYLLATAPKPTGSFDTGSGAGRAVQRNFTRQQIADPAFYAANREAILEAGREGRITG